MKIVTILLGYLKWHYGKAVKSIGGIWKNFLFFIYEFFSIRSLIRNLFDPWKRMTDPYPSHFSFKAYLFSFITNFITRIVGIIMRLALLFIGITAYLLFCVLFPVTIIIWLALPFIIFLMIVLSLFLIIK